MPSKAERQKTQWIEDTRMFQRISGKKESSVSELAAEYESVVKPKKRSKRYVPTPEEEAEWEKLPKSWWCDTDKVEVYDRRCPHCGKLERDKA
jgi:hypothetical protein